MKGVNRTVTKFLVIIVRYHCKMKRKTVEEFFALPKVVDAIAQGLRNLIVEQFEETNIPLHNIIGFASDNARWFSGVTKKRPAMVSGFWMHQSFLCFVSGNHKKNIFFVSYYIFP